MKSPLAPHESTPAEVAGRLETARRGAPFLVLRDGTGAQVIVELRDLDRLTIGRRSGCDIRLAWDTKVSRLHAELQRIGEEWTVNDDGLSHNGTYVGQERVQGQRRLRDGDLVVCGDTVLAYCDPRIATSLATETGGGRAGPALSDGDRRVLAALCRPVMESRYAAPATNADIAAELHLSVAAVKSRLHVLFERFELEHLPQNQKRAALAADAIRAGIVRPSDG